MDLKIYYQKIREIEATLTEDHVVVESLPTPDGGRGGVLTEVPKALAARMMVDGRAKTPSEEAAAKFRQSAAEAKRALDAALESSRVHLSLVPTHELNQLRSRAKSEKN